MKSTSSANEKQIIESFQEFVEKNCLDELSSVINSGEPSLNIDLFELDKYDPVLVDLLTDEPKNIIPMFEEAIKQIEIAEDSKIKVRFFNMPESRLVKIRDIRSKHIGILIGLEGQIKQASEVRPVAILAVYECPACGTEIEIIQTESTMKEPSMCSCGRKGKFKMASKKLVDTQRIIIEETPDKIEGEAQPRRFSIFLTEDLVEPRIEKKTNPGNNVVVIGIVREIPMTSRGGMKTTKFDIIMEANNIETSEQEFEDLDVTPEDIVLIKEIASSPDAMKKLVGSIAPSIFGYEGIKEAIALQLFGGVQTPRPDKTRVRGDVHILLVGDPGVAKSQMLKYVTGIAPKARYVSGKGTSSAGLTASVVKDEFLQGWSLEAGALVLANKGIVCIDEIDKMDKDDRVAMHEAMEQQTVTISKANIHSTLRAETTILAAANPKLGRFDPYQPIGSQIDMPPTLISRFDLIFAIRDLPSKDKDSKLATHILQSFRNPEELVPEIAPELMQKYIAYARKNHDPRLTKEAVEEIRDLFVSLRSKRAKDIEEGGIQPIPISARQLEAIVRLSQAAARMQLKDDVTRDHAKIAINLMINCLKEVGVDTETGELDIDRLVTGITTSTRNRIHIVRGLVKELEVKYGSNIPIIDLIDAAKEKGLEEAKVEEIVDRLKRDGELFEPRHGMIRRMPR